MLAFDLTSISAPLFLNSYSSYLLSDFLLHFDRGTQFSHLLDAIAGVAAVFPKHVVL